MKPLVGTYDLKLLSVTYGGIPLSGWADGDAVTITKRSDDWTEREGSGGDVIRSRMNSDLYDVTINLLPTSAAIPVIEAARLTDKVTGKGAKPLVILDPNSGEVFAASSAWVKKSPDQAFGQEKGNKTYNFSCIMEAAHAAIMPTPAG